MTTDPKTTDDPTTLESGEDDVALVAEERLAFATRETVTGRVRVETVTETVEENLRQSLSRVDVEIDRVAVGRVLEAGAAPPEPRTEGNVTIIPIIEETLVVEKRLVVKEEIRLTRSATTEILELPVSLRKQRAVVERLDSQGAIIAEPQEQTS